MKVGDVVRLNSGSPRMTVNAIGTEGKLVSCVWFTDNGEDSSSGETLWSAVSNPHIFDFYQAVLTVIEDDEDDED